MEVCVFDKRACAELEPVAMHASCSRREGRGLVILRVLEAEDIAHFVHGLQHLDDVLARVRRRQTEPGAALHNGRGGIAHNDNADAALFHLASKSAGEKKENGRNGRH